jgi:hypothetical protein
MMFPIRVFMQGGPLMLPLVLIVLCCLGSSCARHGIFLSEVELTPL